METPNDETLRQHLTVILRAQGIYKDRMEVRGDHWTEFDEHDSFHHLKSKTSRIQHILSTGGYREPGPKREELLDSCYDAINYAAFLVRHVTGELPGMPPHVLRSGVTGEAGGDTPG